jgi:hypothetical protein
VAENREVPRTGASFANPILACEESLSLIFGVVFVTQLRGVAQKPTQTGDSGLHLPDCGSLSYFLGSI